MQNIIDKFLSLEQTGILSPVTDDIKEFIEILLEITILFKTPFESFDLAIEIFRIIYTKLSSDKDPYLYAISSHHLATQMADVWPPELGDYEYICSRFNIVCSKEDIARISLEIYNSLDNNVYLPTTSYFTRLYTEHLNLYGDPNKIYLRTRRTRLQKIFHTNYLMREELNVPPSLLATSLVYLVEKNMSYKPTLEDLSDIPGYNEIEILSLAVYISESVTINRNTEFNVEFKFFKPLSLFRDIKYESLYLEGGSEQIELSEKKEIHGSYVSDFPSRVEYTDLVFGNHLSEIEKISKIGEGSYSSVFVVNFNGKRKAMKKAKCGFVDGISESELIEISLLKTFCNSNIIAVDFVDFKIKGNSVCPSIIFELLEGDLSNVSRSLVRRSRKRYILQLFNAVKYIHDLGVIHNDIKPENILVKGEDIKLADFGISLPYTSKHLEKTAQVYSLPYRPIEILLGDRYYDFNADIWACGVTIFEIITQHKLFNIRSKTSVIYDILKYIGTENLRKELSGLNDWKSSFPVHKPNRNFISRDLDDTLLIDLLENTITLPSKRLTIEQCINHPWLSRV